MPLYTITLSRDLDRTATTGQQVHLMGPYGFNSNTTNQYTLAAGATDIIYLMTPAYLPNTNTTSSLAITGSASITFTVTNKNVNITTNSIYAIDISNNITEIAPCTLSSTDCGTSPLLLTYTGKTGYTFSCTDRLFTSFSFGNPTMSIQSVTVGFDSSTTYIYTNIDHNTPGCRDTQRNRTTFLARKIGT